MHLLDDGTRMLSALEKGALMAKIVLKSAFRMITVQRQDWELLGMKWKETYYVDKCLPFELRSAPYLFAKDLQWAILFNNCTPPVDEQRGKFNPWTQFNSNHSPPYSC